jgi:photosystem II stability/assembly factor-like uncharacterized protein
MKKISILIILLTCFYLNAASQNSQDTIWTECNTGISTQLNCAAVPFSFYQTEAWLCGNNGVVLKTTNQGNNWVNVGANGIPQNLNLVTIWIMGNSSPYSVITAGNDSNNTYVYRTINGGQNWTLVFYQNGGRIRGIRFSSYFLPANGIMIGDPVGGRWSIWKSLNNGANWDSTGRYLIQSGTEHGFNNSLWTFYSYIDTSTIYIGTNNSRIYYSSNWGTSWTARTTAEQNIYSLYFSGAIGFAGGLNLLKSTNNGLNWVQISAPGSGNIISIGSLYTYTLDLVCLRSDNRIYFTKNNGANWLTYTAPSGNYVHVNTPYIWGEGMFYQYAVRTNGGASHRFTYVGAVKCISTETPDKFFLSQNYPNPFNPKSNIKFQIAKSGDVKLVVFDVLGREITTLVNEQLSPGTYEVEWDGTNHPSGVYFYKLITADFSETRKMVLVK